MAVFGHIPALIRMALVFLLVLYALRKKMSLGNSFMLGAAAMAFLFDMTLRAALKSTVYALIYPKTLSLALVVSLILVLSNSMETTGQMKRLLSGFRGMIANPRLNLVVFPALIGLLPMPGGAVFSAPMVKEMAGDNDISSHHMSFINYWFRHIWEYWWPMYPGVLLATLMADIDLTVFVLMMFPLTLAALYLGGFPVKTLDLSSLSDRETKRPPIRPFLHELMPILIVIVFGLGLGMVFSTLFPELSVAKEAGLIISLLTAVAWIWHENRVPPGKRRALVFNMKMFDMAYMVVAILVFKEILTGSRAVALISEELTIVNVPLVFIAVLLPFIVGLFTGITIAFVGSTFPILISLVQSHGEAAFMPAYIMVGLTCGFAGVLLSPLHLCLLLSNRYFETSLDAVYRHLWTPCACMGCAAMGYFWVLHQVF
jgi:uncharacterized protein